MGQLRLTDDEMRDGAQRTALDPHRGDQPVQIRQVPPGNLHRKVDLPDHIPGGEDGRLAAQEPFEPRPAGTWQAYEYQCLPPIRSSSFVGCHVPNGRAGYQAGQGMYPGFSR
jgi:hypothetical protein